MNKTAIELIKKHEGFRTHKYKCTAGRWTIGYGYNLEANPLHLSDAAIDDLRKNGITEARAAKFLTALITDMEQDLMRKLPWFKSLNEARQAVLLDMVYNLGVNGLMGFKKTLLFIKSGQYTLAKSAMLDSTWARQVPNRARELAEIMKNGFVK